MILLQGAKWRPDGTLVQKTSLRLSHYFNEVPLFASLYESTSIIGAINTNGFYVEVSCKLKGMSPIAEQLGTRYPKKIQKIEVRPRCQGGGSCVGRWRNAAVTRSKSFLFLPVFFCARRARLVSLPDMFVLDS